MEHQENWPVFKDLSGKTFDEKFELIQEWEQNGTISHQCAGEIRNKLISRKKLKEMYEKGIKAAEKDTTAFEALSTPSSRQDIRRSLEKLRDILRLKRKAWLTDRYFNPELSRSEKKALDKALQYTTYQACTYEVCGVLVEVLKYPIKDIKMQANAFMEEILESSEELDYLLWGRILGKQYVAKRQWQQMIDNEDLFRPYTGIFSSAIKSFIKKGDMGAKAVAEFYNL